MNHVLSISVECYAGYRGEETPVRFRLGDRLVQVDEVLDRWLAPDHRYFKVRAAEGDSYILRNNVMSGEWELTFFERGSDRPGHVLPSMDGPERITAPKTFSPLRTPVDLLDKLHLDFRRMEEAPGDAYAVGRARPLALAVPGRRSRSGRWSARRARRHNTTKEFA